MSKETKQDWVAVMSFSVIQNDNPEFQEILSANVERWKDEAERAGLDPEKNVRIEPRDGELCIVISAKLDASFTPEQTEWWAV